MRDFYHALMLGLGRTSYLTDIHNMKKKKKKKEGGRGKGEEERGVGPFEFLRSLCCVQS